MSGLRVTAERHYRNGRCRVWMRCECGATVQLSRLSLERRDQVVADVIAAHGQHQTLQACR
jgi:hypothetical protein